MPYKLKMLGLREAEKFVKDEVEKIKVKIKEISEDKYELDLGKILIDFSLNFEACEPWF